MSEMPQQPTPARMEKEEEKEREKQDEKRTEEKNEKSWDEKWRRDPVSSAGWAVVLIWAGLVLMAENLGMLAGLRPLDPWDLIFLGAGVIVLIGAAIRLTVPTYRRPVGGTLVMGVILMAIGLNDLGRPGVIWAGAIILLGVFLLFRGLVGRK